MPTNFLKKTCLVFTFGSLFFVSSLNATGEKIIKSFSEKKKIAEEMKPIAKALGVNCQFCHVEANKGLRSGDFQILTRKGEFAKQNMFPLSKKFFVQCSYCHVGKNQFTQAGMRSLEDLQFIRNYNREMAFLRKNKKINCLTCHILPEENETNPFKKLKIFQDKNSRK